MPSWRGQSVYAMDPAYDNARAKPYAWADARQGIRLGLSRGLLDSAKAVWMS